jgi:YidC/Oxa1 family membrane protein insertase
VFFALYKTLFVTIEMRHAPFFGWIHDLSAGPDQRLHPVRAPPVRPDAGADDRPRPASRHLAADHQRVHARLRRAMGVTMWFQMKLNPTPPDPTQAMIFNPCGGFEVPDSV